MRFLNRVADGEYVFFRTDHLHAVFGNVRFHALGTDCGTAAFQGAELARAQDLPAATIIRIVLACACCEECALDRLKVAFRNVDRELVHDRGNPTVSGVEPSP